MSRAVGVLIWRSRRSASRPIWYWPATAKAIRDRWATDCAFWFSASMASAEGTLIPPGDRLSAIAAAPLLLECHVHVGVRVVAFQTFGDDLLHPENTLGEAPLLQRLLSSRR